MRPLIFLSARAITGFARPYSRRPDIDESLIRELSSNFPAVASRQLLPPEAPLQIPHLVVQSTSSRLAISAAGAEFQTNYYGGFERDYTRAREYLRNKLLAVINSFATAIGSPPSIFGIVLTLNTPFDDTDPEPAHHLLTTHLRRDLSDSAAVQEVQLRIALRVDDRYFLSISLNTYETKLVERPVFPGTVIQVKPWEGSVSDRGVSADLDVNNRLLAIQTQQDPIADAGELDAMLTVLDKAVSALPDYIASGRLHTAALVNT